MSFLNRLKNGALIATAAVPMALGLGAQKADAQSLEQAINVIHTEIPTHHVAPTPAILGDNCWVGTFNVPFAGPAKQELLGSKDPSTYMGQSMLSPNNALPTEGTLRLINLPGHQIYNNQKEFGGMMNVPVDTGSITLNGHEYQTLNFDLNDLYQAAGQHPSQAGNTQRRVGFDAIRRVNGKQTASTVFWFNNTPDAEVGCNPVFEAGGLAGSGATERTSRQVYKDIHESTGGEPDRKGDRRDGNGFVRLGGTLLAGDATTTAYDSPNTRSWTDEMEAKGVSGAAHYDSDHITTHLDGSLLSGGYTRTREDGETTRDYSASLLSAYAALRKDLSERFGIGASIAGGLQSLDQKTQNGVDTKATYLGIGPNIRYGDDAVSLEGGVHFLLHGDYGEELMGGDTENYDMSGNAVNVLARLTGDRFGADAQYLRLDMEDGKGLSDVRSTLSGALSIDLGPVSVYGQLARHNETLEARLLGDPELSHESQTDFTLNEGYNTFTVGGEYRF